jgi:hypothetical protein
MFLPVFIMKKKILKSMFIGLFQWLPDRIYTELMYFFYFKRWPNLKKPNLYTEKLQALKLLPVQPLVALCADKAGLRDFISSLKLDNHLTDILDITDSLESIRWNEYHMPYIVKISNASGYNIIVRSIEDIEKAKSSVLKWSNIDFSKRYRERYYQKSPRRYVVEPYLENLRDIRVHCFNGEPTFIAYSFVEIDGNPKVMLDFNCQIEPYPFTRSYTVQHIPEIKNDLVELYELTKKLCKPFSYVRVDTYRIDGVIKVGEMTFTPLAGLALKDAIEVDKRWGKLIINHKQWVNE